MFFYMTGISYINPYFLAPSPPKALKSRPRSQNLASHKQDETNAVHECLSKRGKGTRNNNVMRTSRYVRSTSLAGALPSTDAWGKHREHSLL